MILIQAYQYCIIENYSNKNTVLYSLIRNSSLALKQISTYCSLKKITVQLLQDTELP